MALGSIVVRLSMRTAEFETDANRASKAAEKRAKEIDAAFRKAGLAIGTALGAAAVAVGASVKKSIDRMDEMAKASARVGQSTEEFSKLVYAGSLADVEMSTLVSTMGKLTKAQAAALDSGSKQAKVFDALGISAKNTDGSLRSSSDVLLDFADRFKAMGGSQEAIAAGFELFGRSFQDIIPLIKDGADGLRLAGDEAARLGMVVDSEAAAAAEKFNDDITRMQSAVVGVAMDIASGLLPSLTEMSQKMVDGASGASTLKDFGDGLATVMVTLANAVDVVVRAVQTLAIAFGTAVEQGRAFSQIAAGVMSFDSGKIRQGFGDYTGAATAGRGMVGDVWGRSFLEKAGQRSSQFSNVRSSVSTLSAADGAKAIAEQLEMQRRLQAMFGGGSGGSKSGKSGLSQEAKEAQALTREYESLLDRMREREALFGATTEEARVLYEVENGGLKALDQARKDELVTAARKLDYMEKEKEAMAEAVRIAEEATQIQIENERAAADRYADVVGGLQEEIDMLRMTNREQEAYNALKYAGVDATSAQGQAIVEMTGQLQSMRELRELGDGITSSFENMFTSFLDGTESASEAFKSFIDDLTSQILKFLVNQAVQKMFEGLFGGSTGGAAGANGGGFWMSLFGSLFGGGRAAGGPVSGSRLYEVGEGGNPELFQQGGKTYLIPGNDGRVVPATSGVSAPAGGMQVVINNHGARVSTKQESRSDGNGMDVKQLVIDIVADSMNGGQLGALGKNRYGWREAV